MSRQKNAFLKFFLGDDAAFKDKVGKFLELYWSIIITSQHQAGPVVQKKKLKATVLTMNFEMLKILHSNRILFSKLIFYVGCYVNTARLLGVRDPPLGRHPKG